MRLAIMQPYFFPYLGYYQLINCSDSFVIYDNVEFTKSSWIRRNRILNSDSDLYIIVPVKKASDYTHVREIQISKTFDIKKLLRVIEGAYRRSPYYDEIYPLIEQNISPKNNNLFDYLFGITRNLCAYLNIETELIISSSISIDHSLKSQEKVIAICSALNANEYINPIGGKSLYDKSSFMKWGIKLSFHQMCDIIYHQYNNQFIPNLSIIDVMMFNSKEKIEKLLNRYKLI